MITPPLCRCFRSAQRRRAPFDALSFILITPHAAILPCLRFHYRLFSPLRHGFRHADTLHAASFFAAATPPLSPIALLLIFTLTLRHAADMPPFHFRLPPLRQSTAASAPAERCRRCAAAADAACSYCRRAADCCQRAAAGRRRYAMRRRRVAVARHCRRRRDAATAMRRLRRRAMPQRRRRHDTPACAAPNASARCAPLPLRRRAYAADVDAACRVTPQSDYVVAPPRLSPPRRRPHDCEC